MLFLTSQDQRQEDSQRLKGELLGAPEAASGGITASGTQWLHFLSKGRVEASPTPTHPR